MKINQLNEKAITLNDSLMEPILQDIFNSKYTTYAFIFYAVNFLGNDKQEMCDFFGVKSIDYTMHVAHNDSNKHINFYKLKNPLDNKEYDLRIVYPKLSIKPQDNDVFGSYYSSHDYILINPMTFMIESNMSIYTEFSEPDDLRSVLIHELKETLEHELIHFFQDKVRSYDNSKYDNTGGDNYYGHEIEYDTHTNTLIRKIEKLINHNLYKSLIVNNNLINEILKAIIDPNYKLDLSNVQTNGFREETALGSLEDSIKKINTDIVKYYHKHRDKKKEMKKWKLIIKNIYTHFNG